MVTLRQKPAGVVGLPADTKEQGKRVDFRVDDFSLGIETKGYRLAWKRAAYCPCVPVNDQTEQPDPNCSLCEGSGWLMFTPVGASVDPKVIGTLDGLQAKIATGAAVIHGIMTSIAAHDTPYDQAMRRIEGTKNCSTRAENKLGYYDQLVDLDATIVYSQILETNGTDTDTTRYPIVLANLVRSEGQVFGDPVHYSIVDGDIKWVTIPTKGTRLGIHYLTYPHWRVVEHPHMTRHTLVKFKTTKPTTPQGDPSDLPVQAVCKLEFLL
jgi:hypothetical protein